MKAFSWLGTALLVAVVFGIFSPSLSAQTTDAPADPAAEESPIIGGGQAANDAGSDTVSVGPAELNIRLNNNGEDADVGVAVQLVIVMTLLTLAPSLVILMTSFTRLVIVLGFVRTALGVPSAPANQVIIGLSLFLTLFIMGPVFDEIYDEALAPHLNEEISAKEAMDRATGPIRQFMLRQTRTSDLEFFLELGRFPPTRVEDLPMRVVIPSFITSELQTAFKMGFLIFLPFLVIDFLVSSVLMSLGMMMMPPAIVSLPFKLLLFVLVDGWYLVVRGLVESFN